MQIITEYNQKEAWNGLVAQSTSPASFLQSWEWGEFNREVLGHEIQRWAVMDEGTLRMVFMLIKKNLPGGRFYYYCPRGLVWQKEYADRRANAYGELVRKVKVELKDSAFLRICPPYEFKEYMFGFLKRLGFAKPKILMHTKEPGKTLVMDLGKSQEKLLEEMHSKTRYNIRLSEKKGVKVREMTDKTREKDIEIFCKLTQETAKRDKIHAYDKNYYTGLINYFTQKNGELQLKLYMAEYNKKPLSGAIVIYFAKTASYLHGASSSEARNLMPNHLMQWAMIREAKAAGMELYDFWGISEKNPAWRGITRFKKGFGGRPITFLGTWDYVLDKKWYNLFRLGRLFKKLIP